MSNEDEYWATVYATTGRSRAWYRRRAVARALAWATITIVTVIGIWLFVLASIALLGAGL